MSACPSPQEGRNALVLDHLDIARWAALAMARRGAALLRAPGSLEDLEQEARLALVRAAGLWDAARGVPFAHYARRALKHRLQDVIGPGGVIRLPAGFGWRAGCAPEPVVEGLPRRLGEELPAREPDPGPDPATLAALRRALDSLPPRERQLLTWKFVDGLKGTPLGRRAGVSKSRASRLVRQALARLRGMLGEGP
jgi:DNA-directed RNA polymerase specialized sigma subunit